MWPTIASSPTWRRICFSNFEPYMLSVLCLKTAWLLIFCNLEFDGDTAFSWYLLSMGVTVAFSCLLNSPWDWYLSLLLGFIEVTVACPKANSNCLLFWASCYLRMRSSSLGMGYWFSSISLPIKSRYNACSSLVRLFSPKHSIFKKTRNSWNSLSSLSL